MTFIVLADYCCCIQGDVAVILRKKFPTYKDFAEASIDQLFTSADLAAASKSHANYFASSYIHNLGNGKFEIKPLPPMAQFSPVFGMTTGDFNNDGNLDLVVSGNDYGMEVTNGRLDGMNGMVLLGDGKGNFSALTNQQSGIYIPGDGRSIVQLKNPSGEKILVASQNKGNLKVYVLKKKP